MIIGLSGYARSGKDEVAKILVEDYGYKRVAFADKIRDLLLETNPQVKDGFRVESVVSAYGWDQAKVLFPEIRNLLQRLGVGARKVFGDEFWVAQALKQVHFEENWAWGHMAYDLIAISSWQLNDFPTALEYGMKALEISPNDERLKTNVEFYQEKVNNGNTRRDGG